MTIVLPIAQGVVYAASDEAGVPGHYPFWRDAFKAASRSVTQGGAYTATGKSSSWTPY